MNRRSQPQTKRLFRGALAGCLLLSSLSSSVANAATTLFLSTGLTAPAGGFWLPGPAGTPGHLWVADARFGFCRIDPTPSGNVLNTATCNLDAKPGQPSYDPATSSIYVPDNAALRNSSGVVRLHFDPATETINGSTVLRPLDSLGVGRPDATALDPISGDLYVGYKRSGNIVRIANPSVGVGDSSAVIGSSSDGKGSFSMAFLQSAGVSQLVEVDALGIAAINNPAACVSGCVAQSLGVTGVTPVALSVLSDNLSTLYIGNAVAAWRLDASQLATTTTPVTLASDLSNVSGLAIDPSGTLYALDDPFGGLGPFGQGRAWAIAPGTVVPAPTAPPAPTIGTATAGDAQATVTWTPPATDGGGAITSYVITSNPPTTVTTVAAGVTSATVTGLTNATTYTFSVAATNAIATGPASAPSNAVTPRGAPLAPTGVAAAAGDAQATVSWVTPASDGGSPITSYTVTAAPTGVSLTVPAPSNSATLTGLSNGLVYTFSVTATNALGTSAASAPSNFVTPTAPVVGIVATITSNPPNPTTINTPSFAFSSNLTGATFECSLVPSTQAAVFSPCTSPITYPAQADGSYTFSVTASAAGQTSAPATATFVIQATVPPTTTAPVTVLANGPASLNGVPVTISWSGTACSNGVSGCNIASYHLQESVNGAVFTDVALPSANTTSISRVLKPSPINQSTFTTYRYQVQATSTTGAVSAFSIAPFFVVPAIDDSTSTSFNGSWSGANLVGAFNGQVHFSSTAGAFAGPANPVPGSSFALVSTLGPDRGLAQVSVDGVVVATVDLYAPSLQAGQVVWSVGGLSTSVNHTIKVTALGTHNVASSGSRVDYDALLLVR